MHADLEPKKPPVGTRDRRRHPRYQFSIPITIRSVGGVTIRGMTIELSESGVSAITPGSLQVGASVELEPIADSKVLAAVRHNVGRVFGFEFLNPTQEQVQRIREICRLLPFYEAKVSGI